MLKLPYLVIFISSDLMEEDVVKDEFRIYGDVLKVKGPNTTYKALSNNDGKITANIVYAPSGNYPLLVNIIEDFGYTTVNNTI